MKNTKGITYLAISALFTFSLLVCGCRNEKPVTTKDSIPEKKSVKVGTLSQSISYYEKGEGMTGYEYESANNFALSLGVEATYTVCKDEDELIDFINKGKIDIIAYPIVVSNENKQKLIFSDHTYITRQVLVQRKDSVAQIKKRAKKKHKSKKKSPAAEDTIKSSLLTDVTDLIGKEVWVTKGSKYEERLHNLNDEIGGGIKIKVCENGESVEDLIDKLSKKEIDYTVCDEVIAKANSIEYEDIDLSLHISFEQRAAWAVKDSAMLQKVNDWDNKPFTKKICSDLYRKHFTKDDKKQKKYVAPPNVPQYAYKIPEGEKSISNYDPYFKEGAKIANCDWRWLAAIAFHESRFRPDLKGYSGSYGLMQIMPSTGLKMGAKNIENLYDPEVSVTIASKYIREVQRMYKEASDPNERMKLTLAAYNAGIGHVKDARELAKKYGKDPNVWTDNVEVFMRNMSHKEYYADSVAKHGYINGNFVCNYVNVISEKFEQYCGK